MSIENKKNLSYYEFKNRLVSQINLDDWADECVKFGSLKLLHKKLHRASACTKEQEVPNILIKNWTEYRKKNQTSLKRVKRSKA